MLSLAHNEQHPKPERRQHTPLFVEPKIQRPPFGRSFLVPQRGLDSCFSLKRAISFWSYIPPEISILTCGCSYTGGSILHNLIEVRVSI